MAKDICPVCGKKTTLRHSIVSEGIEDSYRIHIYDCCHAQLKLYRKGKRDPIVKQVEVNSIRDGKLIETLLFNKVYGLRE